MKRVNIDQGWELMKGEPSNIPGMPQETRTVNLPHDYMIAGDVTRDSKNGGRGGFYNGGIYTYTKHMEMTEEDLTKRRLLAFDGCFGNTKINVNGYIVGRHHYGYSPFTIDIAEHLKVGDNRISITASTNAEPSSRWYSGGGIYRHLDMLTAGDIHIANDGIYAHTSHIARGDAFVVLEAEVENHTTRDQKVWVDFHVEEKNASKNGQYLVGTTAVPENRTAILAKAQTTTTARIQVTVENAKLWDLDEPNLYTVKATLSTVEGISAKTQKEEDILVVDQEETTFGIRTLSVDTKNGFLLNGRSVKLKGGCIHHDNGILGAASYWDSEYRKVKLHKDNGYNALRFAHNPMSKELMNVCDALGMIVIDEAYDTWNMPKQHEDFTNYFQVEGIQELTNVIKRDRNHPSIAFWSIGNELPEQGGLTDGYKTAMTLAAHVRTLDQTRPVMGALCSFFNGLDDEDNSRFWQSFREEAEKNGGSAINMDTRYGRELWSGYTESFVSTWDVVGYNYLNYQFEKSHELYPNRVMCTTESKPVEMIPYWKDVQEKSYVIGDFVWTSHDYIGEAGIGRKWYVTPEEAPKVSRMMNYASFPCRTAGTGDFDLCGFEKPQLAAHRICWGSKETFIASGNPANYGKVELIARYGWRECVNGWTWDAVSGAPVLVDVYSGADEVELFLNGESCGRQPAGAAHENRATFDIKYYPGVLEAVSYNGDTEVSRDRVVSAKKPAGIQITLEKDAATGKEKMMRADGQSLAFAVIAIVDADGNRISYAQDHLKVTVEGAATLEALGSGRITTDENYTTGEITTFEGRALAIVRAGYETGNAVIKAEVEGYPPVETVLAIV